ncbi:hypothetical protein M405DRAFT_869856 [Rhizopogon salebrosus TDB-379]|nr:hypothetical protein M405DRAFT_869856 [Rhizopogon salebrosus TDB-379]
MDDLLLQYALVNDDEEMDVLDDEDNTRMVAATLVTGVELSRLDRIESRNPGRLYLCRAQLLPNPRLNTPWQVLYESQNDRAFITTMGFDVQTFGFILTSGFASRWYETPVARPDVSSQGNARPNRRSLDAGGALGLILHYLNSTMHETSLQQIFALIPATVSRYLTSGLPMLLHTLHSIILVVARHPRLHGAFGSIDGLKLPVQTSDDSDIENATYNGWLSEHFVSSVLAFSAEGVVIAARTNAPGSWHDSRLASQIYTSLRLNTPPSYYIVADTAFPRGTNAIDGRIRAPLKHGQVLHGSAAEIEEHMAFNRELLSYRQTAEWGMRGIQGAFGRLRVPLDINNQDARSDLIEICLRLHNLHTIRVGINQIRTVYMKHWQATEDDIEVWRDFENMLFSEQRKKDRVSRFHVTLEYQ